MIKHSLIFIFSALWLISCTGIDKEESAQDMDTISRELKGELNICGADALHPLMELWADQFMSVHPGLKINVFGGGTGRGLDLVRTGKADAAMVSRKLSPGEESLGLIYFPVSREAVLPIIGAGNPFKDLLLKRGVQRAQLSAVYSEGEDRTWGWLLQDETPVAVNAYTRSDPSGAAYVWATYLDLQYPVLAGIPVEGDEGMIRAISADSLGIGYCNAHYAYDFVSHKVKDGLIILPLDFNENGTIDPKEKLYDSICCMQRAVYLGTFPSHLCREMALVTAGIPGDENIRALIYWIYTEGQSVAKKNGYPVMRSRIIKECLDVLEDTGGKPE